MSLVSAGQGMLPLDEALSALSSFCCAAGNGTMQAGVSLVDLILAARPGRHGSVMAELVVVGRWILFAV